MFNPAFVTALDALCASHGIARSVDGKGRIVLVDTGGQETQGKHMLRLYGTRYGLIPEDFGAVITYRGTRYKLVGIKTSRPKYPLDMEHMGDGRVFKFTATPDVISLIAAIDERNPAANHAFLAVKRGRASMEGCVPDDMWRLGRTEAVGRGRVITTILFPTTTDFIEPEEDD